MAEDPKSKQTVKEGLSKAAKEALERASSKPPAVAEKAKSEGEVGHVKSTPPGKDDVGDHVAPGFPKPDSKAEAPLKSFHKETVEGPMERKSKHPAPPAGKKRTALLLAEYDSPGACMHAAESLRDAGYTKFDAHTPFPVHGMDKAMGLPDSKLGWIVLVCGLSGVSCAFAMMYWMNNIDYPIIIGGKPTDIASVPSMIPIMFELTVLFSAFGAVFGMLHLNRLPQHHHPIFESDRFGRFSDDKFFLSVEAEDPKFKLERTRELLEKTHATFVEVVEETVS